MDITREDFVAAQQARLLVADFVDLVLDRYKVYALVHEDRDVDAIIKQGGNFIRYGVHERSLFDDSVPDVDIIEHTDNDRGPGSTRVFSFPKTALFETTERERYMQAYLALGRKLGLA